MQAICQFTVPGSTPPQPHQAAPALLSCPSLLQEGLPWTFRFSGSLQMARTNNRESRMRSGSSTAAGSSIHCLSTSQHGSLPQHWGLCTPHHSGCQVSNPTGEEFKAIPKPNKDQLHLDLSFLCNLTSATAQLGNITATI